MKFKMIMTALLVTIGVGSSTPVQAAESDFSQYVAGKIGHCYKLISEKCNTIGNEMPTSLQISENLPPVQQGLQVNQFSANMVPFNAARDLLDTDLKSVFYDDYNLRVQGGSLSEQAFLETVLSASVLEKFNECMELVDPIAGAQTQLELSEAKADFDTAVEEFRTAYNQN